VGLRVIPVGPRLARRDQELLCGADGPPSCRGWERVIGNLSGAPSPLRALRVLRGAIRGGRGHRKGREGSPKVARRSTPCALRTRVVLWGGWAPILPRPAIQDWERVAGAENPLCPPCPPWFIRGERGFTTESTEVAEGPRVIPVAPRLARRDRTVFSGAEEPPSRRCPRSPGWPCVFEFEYLYVYEYVYGKASQPLSPVAVGAEIVPQSEGLITGAARYPPGSCPVAGPTS